MPNAVLPNVRLRSHKVIIGCVMADGGRRAITWESDRGIIVLWRIKGAPAAERIYGNREYAISAPRYSDCPVAS